MEIQNKELHRVALTAIIQKDGKFLIAKRNLNKKAFPGQWGVPGGGLEVDDYINTPKSESSPQWYFALTNTLKREVKEEVNLEIKNIRYLLDLTFIRPDGIPAIVLSYYADWQSGEVKLNDENIEYKWISAEEAKNYDMIEGVAEEIEMVDRIIKGEDPMKVEYRGL